jgi:branched-chain amino acid transport system permease protein
VVTGIAAGAVYGLVGICQTLIYRTTGIVNFAFGDLLGLAIFATLLLAVGTGPVTETTAASGRFAAAAVVGVAACAIASAFGYVAFVQPFLARHSTVGWVAATLAMGFGIRALVEATFERPSYVFPDPIPFADIGTDGFVTIAGAQVKVRAFFVIVVACVLAVAAAWLLARTRIGRGLAAIIDDPEGAALVGVPVERFRAYAFAAVGVVAGVAAVAAAPSAPVDAQMGALLGVKGLAVAVIVGFAGFGRTFVAGLAFGLAEAALANDALGFVGIGVGFRELLPMAVAIAVLAFRPPRGAREWAD